MKKLLDIENWERKEHFRFFRKFEEPFFGVTVEIDCTTAYAFCKNEDKSFFLYYLYKSLVAANRIEAFRYRINREQVYVYDIVNASPTINRENGTFGFAYMEFKEGFKDFEDLAKKEIERVRNSTELLPAVSGENVIHYSVLPWLFFTSLSHARSFSFPDSCPKITFGKIKERHKHYFMPVSIHVHHALMDGYHVGRFVEEFQELMR
jgi:chloramphenicol O-acetyltransferase type A